ncbi:MAG TPA: hypothetical protein VNB06_23040 [Thermoanaerobaculia bacterium]|nr:hypothetical protein [Thermoanaerobaculia bacterium]
MPILEALVDPVGRILRSRGNLRVLRKMPDRMDVVCPGQDVSRAFVLATAWRPDGGIGLADAMVAVSPVPGVPEQLVIAVSAHYGLTLRIDNDPAEIGEGDRAGSQLACAGIRTRDWYAWADTMPPSPHELHVIGQAEVPNPGVEPLLTARPPSGDPRTLHLDFSLHQEPGSWPSASVWKPMRFDRALEGVALRRVVVYCGEDVIADVAIDEVQ